MPNYSPSMVLNKSATMNRCLTIEELDDKTLSGMSEIFRLSFEYLLTDIAIEYSKTVSTPAFKSIKDFNERNRVPRSLFLSYPFFVAVSNGHSASLYSLFGKFYATSFGPASLSVYRLIEGIGEFSESKFDFYKLGAASNPLGIEIKNSDKYDGKSVWQAFKEIKDEILSSTVSLADENSPRKFMEFSVDSKEDYEESATFGYSINIQESPSAETPLYKAIEASIEAIQSQSNHTFFDGTEEGILFQSRYFKEFRAFRQSNSPIPYGKIEPPKFRPFFAE